MDKRLLTKLGAIALLAVVGYFQKDRIIGDKPSGPPNPIVVNEVPADLPKPVAETPKASRPKAEAPNLMMKNMQIRDVDGSIAYRGDVDLAPALKRIKAGQRDSHANDGAVFGNRERLLPQKERGYYREYVVRTPGIRHAGPQRIVMGRNGEVYYTHDHYQSFTKIQQ
jgi:filamentous hemagglutinin